MGENRSQEAKGFKVKDPDDKIRCFYQEKGYIRENNKWHLITITPMSQQLRRVIRARLGLDPASGPLKGREESDLPGWYPVWCERPEKPVKMEKCSQCRCERVGKLCQGCDEGIFWLMGGKGRYTTIRPPDSWEEEQWHRVSIKLPMGEDRRVERKCCVLIKREHEVSLPNSQGIQMTLRVRRVKVEVTNAMYQPEKKMPGITTVVIIAREFTTRTVEVLIAGRTMWSTCMAFVKYASYPKERKRPVTQE